MKKLFLGLLIGGLAMTHHASAAIRTFDYSATVNSLVFNDERMIDSAPGIVDGAIVSKGDTITGRFSFDDAAIDWSNPAFETSGPALAVSATFVRDGASFDAAAPRWTLSRQSAGRLGFGIGTDDQPHPVPFIALSFSSNTPFAWELGNGTSGSFAISWNRPGVSAWALGNITSLTEAGVSPVPEPSTYAMLLLGAGVVAGGVRRKQRKPAV